MPNDSPSAVQCVERILAPQYSSFWLHATHCSSIASSRTASTAEALRAVFSAYLPSRALPRARQKELCQAPQAEHSPQIHTQGCESTKTPPSTMRRHQLAALCLVSVACGFITPTRHAAKPSFDPLHLSKKESTWDRLTGPKLFKTVKRTEGIHAVPLVPLRVIAGILMIHHGSEGGFWPANYGTPGFDGFVTYVLQPYFAFLPGSLETWSAIHDYAEFWGGALLAIGFLTRPAALSLLVTMAAAVYFHVASTGLQGAPFGHVENYSYNFEEPLLYALIYLLFTYTGAGPLSVDEKLAKSFAVDEE